jgi:adenylosuccinate lyase
VISRYTRPEMAELWSDATRYALWTRVELAVCRALARRGEIPREALGVIEQRAAVDPERVAELEAQVQHDVNAYLDALAERIGSAARYVHLGLTSSDVLDTALAMQLRDAGERILAQCDRVLEVLRRRALEHRSTVCVGRTHGMFAEPTTFGLKLLYAYDEMERNRGRLARARTAVAVGKISGAVGTFAHLAPEVEAEALAELGLEPARVSTQIVCRDRHAEFFAALAQTATSIERLAVEVRHLARSEIGELQEFFAAEQKGSSAMPHKRNPWRFETLCGLARVVRGYAASALENQLLWHERDISNSSAERILAPDATATVHFMLHRLAGLLGSLVIRPERMRENLLASRGLVFSEGVLLALTRRGLSRQEAYRLVQGHAFAVMEGREHLLDRLQQDPQITQHLKPDALADCFDLEHQLRHVDAIFARVLPGIDLRDKGGPP